MSRFIGSGERRGGCLERVSGDVDELAVAFFDRGPGPVPDRDQLVGF
jgi:hypothetical protein